MTTLKIQALSKVGLVRQNNEDMLSLGGLLLRDEAMTLTVDLDEKSQFYLLVSDGMGGHEFGERASQELLEHLGTCFKEGVFKEESFADDLREQVKSFNDRINQEAIDEGQLKPMGCTLTGVVWAHGKVYLLNAGDSRTYRFRNGILRPLTKDETIRAATGNPYASKALLNCIGGGAEGYLNVEDITDRILCGDSLLICSDGLSDMVTDEHLEVVLNESENPVDELYDIACHNGGIDNVSLIVAEIK
ncbi:MAG: protein phosphatase 2C domain-containing protein [Bacteroidales bacterium]|nr:protein phosphatase 2C domain-containing protein [Bacteroidales bacterium]